MEITGEDSYVRFRICENCGLREEHAIEKHSHKDVDMDLFCDFCHKDMSSIAIANATGISVSEIEAGKDLADWSEDMGFVKDGEPKPADPEPVTEVTPEPSAEPSTEPTSDASAEPTPETDSKSDSDSKSEGMSAGAIILIIIVILLVLLILIYILVRAMTDNRNKNKKRLHGLVALLLAMLMVISNLAWAKEPSMDDYMELIQSSTNKTFVIVDADSIGSDGIYWWGPMTDSCGFPATVRDILASDDDCSKYISEGFNIECNMYKQDLIYNPYEDGSGNLIDKWDRGIVGEALEVTLESTISQEQFEAYSSTYTDSGFVFYVSPVLAVSATPNYTTPSITAICGQTVDDLVLPVELKTIESYVWHDDGMGFDVLDVPMGTWSVPERGDDEEAQVIDENTETVTLIYTLYNAHTSGSIYRGQSYTFEVPVTVNPDLPENPSKDDYESDEDGHWLVCENCDNEQEADEHAFDSGVVVTEATADKDGTKVFTCTVCGFTKNESITYVAPETEETAETEETDETEETVETEETSETEETEEVVESETPAESEEVVESETPTESEEVVESETPIESESPAESEAPAGNEKPAGTEAPAASANTGDAMNTTLMAIIMIAGLCCVLAFRKRVR